MNSCKDSQDCQTTCTESCACLDANTDFKEAFITSIKGEVDVEKLRNSVLRSIFVIESLEWLREGADMLIGEIINHYGDGETVPGWLAEPLKVYLDRQLRWDEALAEMKASVDAARAKAAKDE